MKQAELLARLKEIVGYLESRDFGDAEFFNPSFLLKAVTPEVFRDSVRAMGSFTKSADTGYMNAYKMFGDIKFEAFINRELVCKKVRVGERVVPAEPDTLIKGKPEHIEPVYEYECPETLLGLEVPEKMPEVADAATVAMFKEDGVL